MRIAIIGAGGRYRTEASIARAARSLGHTARVFDVVGWSRLLPGLARPLCRRAVDSFEPELVLLTARAAVLGLKTLTEIARRRKAVFWHFDPQRPPTESAIMLARLTQATFTTYLTLTEEFLRAGAAEAHFLPQGVDPAIDRPASRVPERYRCDVAFIGSGQYPLRYQPLRAVSRAVRLQIRGPGWEQAPADLPITGGKILGPDYARATAGAAINLGLNALPEQVSTRASASNRMWKVLGCGGFYLGPWVTDIEQFARDAEHCCWFRETAQALGLISHFLADPEARRRIALAGHRHALANHTYAHRLRLLLAGQGYTVV
jgi:Glycosyl transferases group 1/DUF based on E. rectale Gene description (DUF3880)